MRWRPSTWLLLSVMFLVAAVLGGRLGKQWVVNRTAAVVPQTPGAALAEPFVLLSQCAALNSSETIARPSSLFTSCASPAPPASWRLSNTSLPLRRLIHSDHAVLMENALLDTAQPIALPIPDHLRTKGDPGTYIIQSPAPPNDAFRALLQAANASLVSYIPNNAYLVRASVAAAQELAANPQVQAVLPYEPYYKLKPPLLQLAVEQAPLPEDAALNVLLFSDARATTPTDLNRLGLEVLSQEPSPFGRLLKVRSAGIPAGLSTYSSRTSILPALAALPGVQEVELARRRVLANDLSRARLGVAADPVVPDNYLGLTGSNVLVNVNDSGVDASHPDLTNRVFVDLPISGTDSNGHGTHVAGIIAGSGLESPTVTNASGSTMPATNFQFRGLAPAAQLFVMAADPDSGPSSSDSYLQETAARTNVFISNNSWHYANDNAYDLAAARYDAAVRDALPEVPGSQPLLFVFGAGNAGNGTDDGLGGNPDSVSSPATAKNVITVGAIEQPRAIAEEVWQCSIVNGTNVCQTNQPWLGMTQTNNEVARFSSRGNVGVTVEGDFGRFKPDVVAPGTFVVSARSTQWDEGAYYQPTNDSNYFGILSNLNNTLGPFYRYESGTSMSAAEVSGVLALMQEFFQRIGRTNSPALMKALLINGARSLSSGYDFQIANPTNSQGWGLINLTNSLPGVLTNLDAPASPMLLFDQDPADALATGQSHTRFISLSASATNQPLRVTLVWTDPPGNPAASLKLVNNLDLAVTNLVTGQVFFGNNFPTGGSFSAPWDTNSPPELDVVNNVENVYLAPPLDTNYSVTVIARGVNVNAVTAQTNNVAQDYALVISSGDGEVPDALAVTDNPIISATASNVTFVSNGFIATLGISGALLLNQRAGANAPLLDGGTIPWPGGAGGVITTGVLSQWQFYVVTNDQSYTNAAFVSFQPASLSVAPVSVNDTNLDNITRAAADIDLYVSTNAALLSLDPAALAGADKSLRRAGTEMIVYSNAAPGTYYVGVKAEGQQAAEYGFLGVFSLLPFATQDTDGSWILRGINLPAVIPDAQAAQPGTTNVLALVPAPILIRRVAVTNEIWHENFSDLIATLSHGRNSVVLNRNSLPPVDPIPYQYTWIYEDNGEGDIPGAQHTDGPGSLRNFIGEQGLGVWLLTMTDQALTHTGLVANLSLRLEPQNVGTGVPRQVPTNAFTYDFVDVPIGATNLTVCVGNDSDSPLPLELYLRRGALPSSTNWDYALAVDPSGGCLSVNLSSLPPLSPGRYFLGVFNPNGISQTNRIDASVDLDPASVAPVTYATAGPIPILDDAITDATLMVSNNQPIASVQVRLHVDHPRISDLALTLISPGGTRVRLFENRGGMTTNGLGGMLLWTNLYPTWTNGNFTANTNILPVGENQGTLFVNYDFYQAPDIMHVYYDNTLIYDTGLVNSNSQFTISFGPGVSTNLVIIMNETNNEDPDDLWEYTATVVSPVPGFVTFTEDTNWAQVPIKFAPPPFVPAGGNLDLYYLPEESLNAFVGQNAFGKWTLEMWDTRAGATNPAPQLLAWQLRFIFDNTVAVPIGLTNGSPGGNSVPPGQIACFYVDVPAWATRATNTLLEASAPVNLFFNPTNPPSGTNAGDAILLSAATNGFATLLTGGSPPLVPGARYYLGVQNPGTSSVTAALQVDFGILAIALTNGIPYFNTNSGAGNATDYYLYTVTTNAVRAQFEINTPTAEMSLAVRNGLPPPTLTSYDCLSANPGTNDELIVLFDDSTPVTLTPGAWYIAAVNVSTTPASYGIRATEFPVYGTDIVITNCQMLSNSLCLTWTSLPGVKYYVQGKPDLNQTNWTTVSPTVTAPGPLTSYCIPLPSPLNFFRVHEGLVLVPYLPAVLIGSIACSTNQVQLQWSAPANLNFQVQWSASVSPPAWNTFTTSVTAANTAYSFIDDGSESGGLTGPRYYRLQQLP